MSTAKTIRPLNDFVLLRRQKSESTTKGGLFIPDDRQIKSLFGEVLAVGPGKYKKNSSERVPMALKPGDVVMLRGVTSVVGEIGDDDEGNDMLMIREEDIDGIVDEP